MKKTKLLLMLFPLVLSGCGNKGVVYDLNDAENKSDFLNNFSYMLNSTIDEFYNAGLEVEGKINNLNLKIDWETFYKDETPSKKYRVSTELKGLIDNKVKNFGDARTNALAETSFKEFNGSFDVIVDDSRVNMGLEDAKFDVSLVDSSIYFDGDNKQFKAAAQKLYDNFDEIKGMAGDANIPDELKTLILGMTDGTYNKIKAENIFEEEDKELPLVSESDIAEAKAQLTPERIDKFLTSQDLYQYMEYKKYKHDDFSIGATMRRSEIEKTLNLDAGDGLKSANLDFFVKSSKDKRLHNIDITFDMILKENTNPILKGSKVDHREVTTSIKLDVNLFVYFNPEFKEITNKDSYKSIEELQERFGDAFSD